MLLEGAGQQGHEIEKNTHFGALLLPFPLFGADFVDVLDA